MRNGVLVVLIWTASTMAVIAGVEDSIVRVESPTGFCSGVCIAPGLILTANHCSPSQQTVVVTPVGERIKVARVIRRLNRGDHTICLVLDEDTTVRPAVLRLKSIQTGDAVESYGYAYGGRLRKYNGQAVSTRWHNSIGGASLLKSTVISSQGTSGGGVFADGKLCAIISGMDHTSTYSLTDVQECLQDVAAKKTTLVAFVQPGCPPCEAFKRDYLAGAFKRVKVKIVSYNPRTGTWSDPALWKEAAAALKKHGGRLAFPTFWIRGTNNVRIGYAQSKGLLQFLTSAIDAIVGGIIGRPPQAEFPQIALVEEDEQAPPPVPDEETTTEEFRRDPPSVDELKSQVSDLRELISIITSDIESFTEAGVIGKVKRIDDLKTDAAAAKNQVAELKKTVDDLRANPMGFLLSVITGFLGGLVKRRLHA